MAYKTVAQGQRTTEYSVHCEDEPGFSQELVDVSSNQPPKMPGSPWTAVAPKNKMNSGRMTYPISPISSTGDEDETELCQSWIQVSASVEGGGNVFIGFAASCRNLP